MKISFVPRYTIAAASSRLRVFTLIDALNRLGLADARVGLEGNPDLIVLQKADDPAVFTRVFGRAVIYDYDDIWGPEALGRGAAIARLFTSDTLIHAEYSAAIRRPYGVGCELLPDPIDYEPQAPLPASENDGLVWFGNKANFESARGLFESAASLARLGTICEGPVSQSAEHINWSREDFAAVLRRFGTAFLSHRGADQGKSANKMIAAVTLGIPCIVSESPAYEALARACGLDWCVVRTAEELQAAYQRLSDPVERGKYLAAIQPFVWENYRADAIAAVFIQIVRSLL